VNDSSGDLQPAKAIRGVERIDRNGSPGAGFNHVNGVETKLLCGDCLDVLKRMPDRTIDLIITSPPYADQRKKTYGGIHPDKYVEWFLERSSEFLRVLKPTGSFVLNIKERVHNGERHVYVLELILALRKQGWLWTEEYIWHKKNCHPGKGPTDFAMPGNAACTSPGKGILKCRRTR
jgi:DNA modification methylase